MAICGLSATFVVSERHFIDLWTVPAEFGVIAGAAGPRVCSAPDQPAIRPGRVRRGTRTRTGAGVPDVDDHGFESVARGGIRGIG